MSRSGAFALDPMAEDVAGVGRRWRNSSEQSSARGGALGRLGDLGRSLAHCGVFWSQAEATKTAGDDGCAVPMRSTATVAAGARSRAASASSPSRGGAPQHGKVDLVLGRDA